MNKEQFCYLVEIQSLNTKIMELEQSTTAQHQRITMLNMQIEEAKQNKLTLEENRSETRKIINNLEKENSELIQLIERTSKNLDEATTEKQAQLGEKELKNLGPRLTQNEELLLEKWEYLDLIEKDASEKSQFLIGVAESLQKVEAEVYKESQTNENEINKLNERKSELIDLLPSEAKSIYLNLEKKYPIPVAYLESKKCGRCKGAIDQSLLVQINSLNTICLCPFCERIIISPEVQY